MATQRNNIGSKTSLTTRYVPPENQLTDSEIDQLASVQNNNASEIDIVKEQVNQASEISSMANYQDIAAATAAWNAASPKPDDGLTINIESESFLYKWDSTVTEKVTITDREKIKKTDDVNDTTGKVATMNAIVGNTGKATELNTFNKDSIVDGVNENLSKIKTSEHNLIINIGKYYDVGSLNIGDVFDGSLTVLGSFYSGEVDCVGGEKIFLQTVGGTAPRAWCFVNSSDEIISYADAGLDTYTSPIIITAPPSSVKLYVNNNFGSAPKGFTSKVTKLTEYLLSEIDSAESNAISVASSDATSKANTAESNSNTYTDTKKTEAVSESNSYTDTKKIESVTEANAYTDDNFSLLTYNVNTNNKFVKGIELVTWTAFYDLTKPELFLAYPFTTVSETPSLVDENEHSFNYTGDALKIVHTGGVSIGVEDRLVIPYGSDLPNGEEFDLEIDIQISNSGNGIINITNQTVVAPYVGSVTHNFVANTPVTLKVPCVSNSDDPIKVIKWDVGQAPFEGAKIYIGEIRIIKNDALEKGVYEASKKRLLEDGYISDSLGDARNLIDINRQEVEMSHTAVGGGIQKPNLNVWYRQKYPAYSEANKHTCYNHVDASSTLFDYEGNAMVLDCTTSQIDFHILFEASNLEIPTYEFYSGDYLYMNIEMYSPDGATFNRTRATKYENQNIGGEVTGGNTTAESLTNYTLSTTPEIIKYKIPREDLSGERGVRIYFDATQDGKTAYIGRIVLSDYPTDSVDISPLARIYPTKKPRKIVEIGHSKVEQQRSINQFCIMTGNWYSSEEVDNGKNGFSPSGIGGTLMTPIDGATDAILNRANDMVNYNGDDIVIYGATNDVKNDYISDGSMEYIIGSFEDTPYLGNGSELDYAGYRAYWQTVVANSGVRNPASPYDVTLAACYMGCIEKLQTNQLDSAIYIKTEANRQGGNNWQKTVWMPINKMIRDVGELYNCKIIDIAKNTGVNAINAADNYDAPLVHENEEFGRRIALEWIKTVLE